MKSGLIPRGGRVVYDCSISLLHGSCVGLSGRTPYRQAHREMRLRGPLPSGGAPDPDLGHAEATLCKKGQLDCQFVLDVGFGNDHGIGGDPA